MKNKELFYSNEDILCIMENAKNIGWNSIKEQSIQRILYLIKVLYSFIYNSSTDNIFNYYSFSVSLFGPYSIKVRESLAFLRSNLYIKIDDDGNYVMNMKSPEVLINTTKKEWIKDIILIIGKYGENRIFGFTINDPLYKEAVETNRTRDLDTSSPDNKTIMVLNEFRTAFEETLDDVSNINPKEYLDLYFEYTLSKLIKN